MRLRVTMVLLLFVAGCAPAIERISGETYRLKGLTDESFSGQSLAILPVMGLKKEALAEETHGNGNPIPFIPPVPSPYTGEIAPLLQKKKPEVVDEEKCQRVATDLLAGSFKRKREDIFVVPPEKCLALIRESGLMESYERRIVEYASIWILEKAFLKELSKCVNVRYVLVSQLVSFSSQSRSTFVFIWKLGRLYVERTTTILGQIWDTQSGEVAWMGHGTAYHKQGIYRNPPHLSAVGRKGV